MKTRTSLGNLISELYDTVHGFDGTHAVSHVVTVCTLDLLMRQRRRGLIAALLNPPETILH